MEESLLLLLSNINKIDETFIDSILTLSINGLFISYDQLMKYCNDNQSAKNKKLNNNNKRSRDSDEEYNQIGLNSKQIELLYQHTKTLDLEGKQKIINNVVLKNDHGDYDSEKYNYKIKFLHSIGFVIENNKKHINQQKQITDSNKLSSSSSSSSLLLSENKEIYIVSEPNEKSDRNYFLFKKVWSNLIVRSEILFHLRIYNCFLNFKYECREKDLKNFRYRSYLNSIKLKGSGEYYEDENDQIDQDSLPYQIQEISFCDSYFPILGVGCIPESIKKLKFHDEFNSPLSKDLFKDGTGDSVTSITMGNRFNKPLNWLPKNLKSIKLGWEFQQNIYPGQLPSTLESIRFSDSYRGTITPGSLGEFVNGINVVYDGINHQKIGKIENFNENKIPSSAVCLEFGSNFNGFIQPGDIPHSVTSLKFPLFYNQKIRAGTLPPSIKSITFGDHWDRFIEPFSLPPSLTSLKFGKRFNNRVDSGPNQVIIPSSITNLEFGASFNQVIPIGLFRNSSLKNLKFGEQFDQVIHERTLPKTLISLDLGGFNKPILVGSLPQSLENLRFGSFFNQPLTLGSLPSNLKSLELSSNFNHQILVGVLPDSITNLIFGYDFDIEIDYFVLPKSLKTLTLQSPSYPHHLSLAMNVPKSLKSIYINRKNLYLIQSLKTDFFSKYIRLFELE
ncbi:hypothetical protein RB653_002630 [Dictyostelium firmibasis]|uniref:FNIP repeat-containing protein n=1 Tax=Dictyostelium firmibasis TaxID=79012 RepID=A0AAN7YYU9_9MYCE